MYIIKISYAIALVLLATGLYSVVQNFFHGDIRQVATKINKGQIVATDDLNKISSKYGQNDTLSGSGNDSRDIGLIEFTLARRYGYFSKTGLKHLKTARMHTHAALEKAPAQSIGWLRLAYIDMLLDGNTSGTSRKIYMSVITAPYNYTMMYYRLNLAFIAWNNFEQDEQDLIRQQIRIGWRWNKRKMRKLIKSDKVLNIVREALSSSEKDRKEFDKMFQSKNYG